jgi:two-component system nitrogen regulation response regulator GlnG
MDKILIVEDESLIGWSMANALGKAGYDPEIVDCAEAALEKLSRGCYRLVISEFRLPRMDGLDLAARIREISGPLPVVIISAHEDLGSAELDTAIGIDRCIEKPFNLNDLVDLVGEILHTAPSNLRTSHGPEN